MKKSPLTKCIEQDLSVSLFGKHTPFPYKLNILSLKFTPIYFGENADFEVLSTLTLFMTWYQAMHGVFRHMHSHDTYRHLWNVSLSLGEILKYYMQFPAFESNLFTLIPLSCTTFDVWKRDSHCGEPRDHLPSPQRLWTRKNECGERPARPQLLGDHIFQMMRRNTSPGSPPYSVRKVACPIECMFVVAL